MSPNKSLIEKTGQEIEISEEQADLIINKYQIIDLCEHDTGHLKAYITCPCGFKLPIRKEVIEYARETEKLKKIIEIDL